MPALLAIDALLSPFFETTVEIPLRSLAGNAASESANPSADPTGTRTRNESFGGVIPRSTRELSSCTRATVVFAARATAASGVAGPTRTESYVNGGRRVSFVP